MMRKLNVVLTAATAVALSAAPLSAQWGILGRSSGSSDVPRGHLPPPGQCRVWIDGVPPGHQPAPTSCRTAERQRHYYEQRYGRRARVIYGDRSYGVYDRNGGVYGRSGSNCRYVERVIAGRVIRQRVCDDNGGIYSRGGVYDRDGRVYDRNGNVIYRRDGVYRDGIYRDSRGRIYDRDSDSDSDGRGKNKHKNKHKGKGRGNGRW